MDRVFLFFYWLHIIGVLISFVLSGLSNITIIAFGGAIVFLILGMTNNKDIRRLNGNK